ncbi:hypothetical protein [Plantactinospora mayteni]|uniref:hypothetical protein n=1 Tax=Plantactinospora mayteni TaxID=566021 RepID=UPI001942CACC|nr:hypothetical protein [Plantactinospora mayteni]
MQAVPHAVVTAPVSVVLDQIELLEYHRDRRMYEWTSARPLPIGRVRARPA